MRFAAAFELCYLSCVSHVWSLLQSGLGLYPLDCRPKATIPHTDVGCDRTPGPVRVLRRSLEELGIPEHTSFESDSEQWMRCERDRQTD